MKEELQKELYSSYPVLFSNKDKSVQESCMAWGIETGAGWFDILKSLCYEIKQYEEHLVNESSQRYKKDYVPVKFDQIKEKFGGLRIYYSGGDDFIDGLISMAEAISYKTCESCGNKGKPNESGWIVTLCEDCRNKNESRI